MLPIQEKYPAHDDSDQPLSIYQHLLILPRQNQKTRLCLLQNYCYNAFKNAEITGVR